MRKFLQYALNRVVITALLVLLQIAFFLVVLLQWGSYYVWFSLVLRFITFWAVIYIIWKPNNPAVKLAWVVPILTFPLLGGVLYLCYGHVIVPKKLRDSMERTDKLVRKSLVQDKKTLKDLKREDMAAANQSRYIYSYAATPVWDQTASVFFADGRPWWERLLDDLEKAEHFIFLEFFIIKEGKMWDAILDILERKAKAGVEVRLIYDDVGCVFLLPKYYDRIIEKKGIKCVAFNRLVPFLSLVLNNRDHRKIVVIDGKTAYTGGINLSDEYINYEHPYGDHWKDTGIRIEGKAVWNFTVMFLQMWNMSRYTEEDYSRYYVPFEKLPGAEGYVQPYMDTPFDDETLGENVYLNMISAAERYIWIYTPYLVTDNEMITALKLAAKRGVDVRIVTPGVPDKKFVYWLTQSNYQNLIEAGVRIFQYRPGFIHAKCVLSDDGSATVGTVNFDYRSFYHHFECGVYLYRAQAVEELKKDMENTFAVCEEITLSWCREKFVKTNVVGPLLKLFSPLM
ncbi:MAG: cardiolipin synthase [Lachnospiraceae bacterium]|nr:cardiolipin synthase [Lachnospiraceae bacterium]